MRSASMFATVLVTMTAVIAAAPKDPIFWEPVHEPGGGGWIVSLAPSPHDSRQVLSGGDMLGMALSADRGERWAPAFGFGSYEMCDITWHPRDPKVVWTGSLMGPYRSDDGGKTWREMRKGMPPVTNWQYSQSIEKILVNPQEPKHLLAFGGTYRDWGNNAEYGAVWQSSDGGESWSRLAKITPEGPSSDLAAKGVNISSAEYAGGSSVRIFIVANTSVYVSEDAGKTWAQRSAGLPPGSKSRLAVHPKDPDIAYLGCGNWKEEGQSDRRPGGVYRTADAGRTWTRISNGLAEHRSGDANLASRYGTIAVSRSNPDVLWTCDSAYNAGIIYKSEDGGGVWRPVAGKSATAGDKPIFKVSTACPAGLSLTGLVADPTDANIAYGYGSEYILRTTDGGKTWIDVTAYRPDASKPNHWKGRGWTGWCSHKVAFNPYRRGQVVLQAGDAARGWISDDGLRTFWYVSGEPNPWCAGKDTSFTPDGRFYITTGQFGGTTGVICAANFGKTVKVAVGKSHGLPEQSWGGADAEGAGVYAHPAKSHLVWAVLGGKMYHSSDGGDRWQVVASKGFQYMAGDPARPGRFYVTGKDGVYVSEDGKTFTNIGGPRPATRGRVTADARGRVYVCQFRDGRPGLWRYTPAANTWERVLDELLAHDCAVDPTDPDRLILTTSQDPYHDQARGNGLWISADGGQTWTAANQGLPILRVNTAAFDPFDAEQLVIGTYGMGFFKARWPKSHRPVGVRSYKSGAEDEAHARPPQPAVAGAYHSIRDFGPEGLNYFYGKSWKDATVTTGTENGVGFVQIDATAAGGGGIVLHGADIAPDAQTHLVLKAKPLPGNQVRRLGLNVIIGGKAHSFSFDLSGLKPGGYGTLTAPLGDLDVGQVEQIQMAGTDFSDSAPRLKLRIDGIGTMAPEANAAGK